MSWVAAAVTVGTAGYKIYSGEKQKSNAKKQAALLDKNRPNFAESPFYKNQLSLAESELSNGGGRAEEQQKEEMDQDLSSSLSAITKMGGSTNDVASLFSANATGRARMALLRSNLRLNQINNLQKAQDNEEEDRQRAFGYNITAPFKDKSAANAQSLISANNEISSGIDTAGSALSSTISGINGKNQLNNYFSNNNNSSDSNASDFVKSPTMRTSTASTNGYNFNDPATDPKYNTINVSNDDYVFNTNGE